MLVSKGTDKNAFRYRRTKNKLLSQLSRGAHLDKKSRSSLVVIIVTIAVIIITGIIVMMLKIIFQDSVVLIIIGLIYNLHHEP